VSCYALDSSALFHGRDMRIFSGVLCTTRNVAEELKDPRAQAALEILRVEVVEVDERKARELARRFGGLSLADASVLLLAMERGCVLVTDDSRLASTARRLGVRARGVYYGV
jgi:UPF0271 protein